MSDSPAVELQVAKTLRVVRSNDHAHSPVSRPQSSSNALRSKLIVAAVPRAPPPAKPAVPVPAAPVASTPLSSVSSDASANSISPPPHAPAVALNANDVEPAPLPVKRASLFGAVSLAAQPALATPGKRASLAESIPPPPIEPATAPAKQRASLTGPQAGAAVASAAVAGAAVASAKRASLVETSLAPAKASTGAAASDKRGSLVEIPPPPPPLSPSTSSPASSSPASAAGPLPDPSSTARDARHGRDVAPDPESRTSARGNDDDDDDDGDDDAANEPVAKVRLPSKRHGAKPVQWAPEDELVHETRSKTMFKFNECVCICVVAAAAAAAQQLTAAAIAAAK